MSYNIYISNKSKLINSVDFNCMITACNALLPSFCKQWKLTCPIILQLSTPISENIIAVTLVDEKQIDVPQQHIIEVRPIITNGGVILYKDETTITVASVVFAEICNLLLDPSSSGWWLDLSSDINTPLYYSYEVCDQVQTNIIKIIVGVSNSKNGVNVGLANFIFPSWKDSTATNVQFDYLNILKSPFECLDSGSIIKFSPSCGVVQTFGKNVPNWLKNFKMESYKYVNKKTFNK